MKIAPSLFINNPLFLATSRERLRPTLLFSYLILVLLVCFLIQLNAGSREHYFYYHDRVAHYGESYEQQKILIPTAQNVILGIAVLQHLLLLFFGTISAYNMSGREKSGGTLEFHRSSPFPRWKQALGLLFGSTALEWSMFLVTIIFQSALALFHSINPLILIEFYLSLAVTAILFHAGAMLVGIIRSEHSKWGGGVGILVGLWLFGHLIFMNDLPALFHLGWLPGYYELKASLLNVPLKYVLNLGYTIQNNDVVLYSFFGAPLPPRLYQAVVQLPILALLLNAVMRRIKHPEHPLFSKGQCALSCFFILFLILGSTASNLLIAHYQHYYPVLHGENLLIQYFYTAVILGVLGSLAVTPTRYVFLKGWRRSKKIQKKSPGTDEDSSSNISWLITYLFIILVIFQFYAGLLRMPIKAASLTYVMLAAYIVFFSQFYEFVQLSRWGKKRIVFWTILIILWVIIPSFGEILRSTGIFKTFQLGSAAISPFSGGIKFAKSPINGFPDYSDFCVAVGVVVFMSLVSSLLAGITRAKIAAEVNREKPLS